MFYRYTWRAFFVPAYFLDFGCVQRLKAGFTATRVVFKLSDATITKMYMYIARVPRLVHQSTVWSLVVTTLS